MNTITVEELEWLLERGEVDLVDVRPEEEFRKLHAYGARSLQLSNLEPHSFVSAHNRTEWVPPPCLMCDRTLRASLAAGLIAGAGLAKPRVLAGGLQAWVKEGLPVVEPKESLTPWRCLTHLADCVRTAAALFWRQLRFHPS